MSSYSAFAPGAGAGVRRRLPSRLTLVRAAFVDSTGMNWLPNLKGEAAIDPREARPAASRPGGRSDKRRHFSKAVVRGRGSKRLNRVHYGLSGELLANRADHPISLVHERFPRTWTGFVIGSNSATPPGRLPRGWLLHRLR
jgi:hypothetical protein